MNSDYRPEKPRRSHLISANIRQWPTDLLAILAAVTCLFATFLTLPNILAIEFTFDRNYNEGWNVYNTARLIHHQVVYDDDYWRVNNYPIGSFLIIAAANFLFDNLLLTGRIVAFISFVAIGLLAAVATLRFGGKRIDAVFSAGCALGFCYLVAPGWVSVDDPQTLGEAVMLGGLVSYISRPATLSGLFRTAFLVVLGAFVKHSVIAIPVAITLDLAIRSPRRLLFWLGCCAGLAAAFVGVTQIVAGGTFIEHLLSPRVFYWYGVRYHLMKYLRLFKFPLIALILGLRLTFTADRFLLAAWGAISIITATIFSGFEGTSYNMFQDAAVFLGVAAGILFSEARRLGSRVGLTKVAAFALPLLLAQPILARSSDSFAHLYNSRALLEQYRLQQEVFFADAKYILESGGRAICENLLLCYSSGQPFTLDPFNSRQYMLAGKLDQRELIERIAAHEFAVIQLKADICDDPATSYCHILHYPQKINRFTDETLYAIDKYYRVARRSMYGTFYVPKEGDQGSVLLRPAQSTDFLCPCRRHLVAIARVRR